MSFQLSGLMNSRIIILNVCSMPGKASFVYNVKISRFIFSSQMKNSSDEDCVSEHCMSRWSIKILKLKLFASFFPQLICPIFLFHRQFREESCLALYIFSWRLAWGSILQNTFRLLVYCIQQKNSRRWFRSKNIKLIGSSRIPEIHESLLHVTLPTPTSPLIIRYVWTFFLVELWLVL